MAGTAEHSGEGVSVARRYAALLRGALGSRVRRVVLFGSRARGDARDGSDFDVLVVVSERTREVREAVLDVAVEMMDSHEALFASLVYDEVEWTRARKFPLAWRIQEEGIEV